MARIYQINTLSSKTYKFSYVNEKTTLNVIYELMKNLIDHDDIDK
jgi:hypothetical protein